MNEEDVKLQPPTAEQVARRALILSAVVCRSSIDGGAGDPDAEALPPRIREWLKQGRLVDHLEPWESKLLESPLGELPQQQVFRATWAVEGLAVLGWALHRLEFPSHDELVDPFVTAEAVGLFNKDAEGIVSAAQLRSAEESSAARELMYAVHCRIRSCLRQRTMVDFRAWIEPAWVDALKLDPTRLIVAGDLGFGGQPISAIGTDALQKREWAVQEHHRASIWLVGEESPTYWGWGVDT